MPPTLTRILWSGVPAAALLAVVGYGLAGAADLFLGASRLPHERATVAGAAPGTAVPTDLLMADARRTLPLIMAAWGFAVVTVYEGSRRLLKPPPKAAATKVPAQAAVDRLLEDLLRKAEADRATAEAVTPPPAATPPPVAVAEGVRTAQ